MEYQFTEEEKRIRKHWLLATRMYYLSDIIIYALLSIILYYLDELTDEIIQLFLVYSIASIIFYSTMKRCAYKKYGTKYMTFVMILSPFGILKDLSKDPTSIKIIITWIIFGLYAWWAYASINLRPVNKKAENYVMSRKFFAGSLSKMKAAKDIQELDQIRTGILKTWPELEE